MRYTRLLLLVLLLTLLAISGCVASVGVGVPIGSPWGGYGPYGGGSVMIGSGPIAF